MPKDDSILRRVGAPRNPMTAHIVVASDPRHSALTLATVGGQETPWGVCSAVGLNLPGRAAGVRS